MIASRSPPGQYGGDAVERLFTNTLDWSAHPYFQTIRGLEVSAHFLVRRVTPAGLVWLHQEDIYVSQTFAGHTVGLDPVSPTTCDVYFAEYLLGTLDLSILRFRPLTHALTSPITPV